MKINFMLSLKKKKKNLPTQKKKYLKPISGAWLVVEPNTHSNVFSGSCKSHINPHNGQILFLSNCSHISLKPFPTVKPLPVVEVSQGIQEEETL